MMSKFKYCLWAAAGLLVLIGVMNLIGPRRALAAIGFTPVRDVDNAARNPYQTSTGRVNVRASFTEVPLTTVPAGSRLVIEYVSMLGVIPSNQNSFFEVVTIVGGVQQVFAIPVTQRLVGTGVSYDTLIATQSLRLYADPGTTPSVLIYRSGQTENADFSATVSGYYVGL